jgi:hypothetical protein
MFQTFPDIPDPEYSHEQGDVRLWLSVIRRCHRYRRRMPRPSRCSVLLPGDAGYEEERAVFSLNHELVPAVVAQGAADVQAAVTFARTWRRYGSSRRPGQERCTCW